MLKHHILATNIKLTKAIDDYLAKKISSLEKFIHDDVEALAKIEVGKTTKHHHKGDIFRAEINLSVGKQNFRAVAETSDLYSAIDEMKDEIVNEVKKFNKKSGKLREKGHRKIKNIIKGISQNNLKF